MSVKNWWNNFIHENLKITIIFIVFLLAGSASTILNKTAYQTAAEGRDGDVHYFTKPLFFNWGMFLGMSLCMIIYVVQYHIVPHFSEKKFSNKY